MLYYLLVLIILNLLFDITALYIFCCSRLFIFHFTHILVITDLVLSDKRESKPLQTDRTVRRNVCGRWNERDIVTRWWCQYYGCWVRWLVYRFLVDFNYVFLCDFLWIYRLYVLCTLRCFCTIFFLFCGFFQHLSLHVVFSD